jgi:outer membrane protein assembly factor BamD (BamD/ComL family)
MASYPDRENASESINGTNLWASALTFTAICLALLAIVWAATELWTVWGNRLADSSVSAPAATLRIVLMLIAAWGGALMMCGFAELLRKWERVVPAEQDVSTLGMSPAQFERLLRTIHEVRDVALLDENQRHQRSEQDRAELIKTLQARIPQLLQRHEWAEARRRISEAQHRFPGNPEIDQIATQVSTAIERAESHDVDVATREVNDLIASGLWDRASACVRELLARHPSSLAARSLLERIANERDRAQLQERSRMMSQAQSATDARNWVEAVRHAEVLIERFPTSIEADALRQQLPTLRSNAEVQIRQKMESEIREMITVGKYSDALSVARTLIERYPTSPQADVLREQLTRLEERAAEQQHVN